MSNFCSAISRERAPYCALDRALTRIFHTLWRTADGQRRQARGRRERSADFQSAVSQIYNLRIVRTLRGASRLKTRDTAGWESALRLRLLDNCEISGLRRAGFWTTGEARARRISVPTTVGITSEQPSWAAKEQGRLLPLFVYAALDSPSRAPARPSPQPPPGLGGPPSFLTFNTAAVKSSKTAWAMPS